MHLAMAILAALVQRGRTGRGQLVEVAMQEAVLNLTRVKFTADAGDRQAARAHRQPLADRRLRRPGPLRGQRAMNDYVYMMLPPDNAEIFEALAQVIGRPDLPEDDRFSTPPARARTARR